MLFVMLRLLLFFTLLAANVTAQGPPRPQTNPLDQLAFLEGTWAAITSGGLAELHSTGTYTFRRDLAGHILIRTSSADTCTANSPHSDCNHHDTLTIFHEPGTPATALAAIYLDSEGHVIHYHLSIPSRYTVVFDSDPAPGPHFRLLYELHEASPITGNRPSMSGKFQMAAPNSAEFHTYLEWNGNALR